MIEYTSNYYGTAGSLSFYSKDKATNFDADIANTNAFKSFAYKTYFLENTVAYWNNSILKSTAIAVLLKHLSYFWRSFEMSLNSFKVEFKIR